MENSKDDEQPKTTPDIATWLAENAPPGPLGEHMVKAAKEIRRLRAEATKHDTPAWEANERLNGLVEKLCQSLEAIRDGYLVNHTSKWAKATAEEALS